MDETLTFAWCPEYPGVKSLLTKGRRLMYEMGGKKVEGERDAISASPACLVQGTVFRGEGSGCVA